MLANIAATLSGRKTARTPRQTAGPQLSTTRRRSSQLITVNEADAEHLQLPTEQVRVLKKTLFHFSRVYTEVREHDIFAVAWDTNDVPKPPESLLAILPPEEWPAPDIIVIAFMNVCPTYLNLWLEVTDISVAEYSPDFIPLVNTHMASDDGHLLLIFINADLAADVQNISMKQLRGPVNALCCRFCLQQAPVCIISAQMQPQKPPFDAEQLASYPAIAGAGNVVGEEENSAGLSSDRTITSDKVLSHSLKNTSMHLESTAITEAKNALYAQRLALLFHKVVFEVNGRLYRIRDHPVTILLGVKDILGDTALDLGSTAAVVDKGEFPSLRRLRLIDLIYLPNTSGQPSVKRFRGSLGVLKAGIMKLIVETDGSGISQAVSPELCTIRIGTPSVDPQRLRHLYRSVWRSMRMSNEQELCAVELSPQSINVPSPLRPFQPVTVRFHVHNPNRSPAAFSILCLSDSGRSLVPLSRYSNPHRAKFSALTNPMAQPGVSCRSEDPTSASPRATDKSYESSRRAGSEVTTITATTGSLTADVILGSSAVAGKVPGKHKKGPASLARDLQKRFFSLKKSTDRSLAGMLTMSSYVNPLTTARERQLPCPQMTSRTHLDIPKNRNRPRTWWSRFSGSSREHMSQKSPSNQLSSIIDYRSNSSTVWPIEENCGGDSPDLSGSTQGEISGGGSRHDSMYLALADDSVKTSGVELEQHICRAELETGSPCESAQGETEAPMDSRGVSDSEYCYPSDGAHAGADFEQSNDSLKSDPAQTETFCSAETTAANTEGPKMTVTAACHDNPTREIPQIRLPFEVNSSDNCWRQDKSSGGDYSGASTYRWSQQAAIPDSLNVAKWLLADPAEGVILGGNSIEIALTICVEAPILASSEESFAIAVRLENCRFDSFLCLNTRLEKSIDGLTLQQLEGYGYEVFRDKNPSGREIEIGDEKQLNLGLKVKEKSHSDVSEPSCQLEVPIEIRRDAGELPSRNSRQLPLPKEIWWLMTALFEALGCPNRLSEEIVGAEHEVREMKTDDARKWNADSSTASSPCSSTKLRESPTEALGEPPNAVESFETVKRNDTTCPLPVKKGAFSLARFLMHSAVGLANLNSKIRAQVRSVLNAVETGTLIDRGNYEPDIYLFAIEKLIEDSAVAVVPRVNVVDISEDGAHLLCRAVLLSLPMATRNFTLVLTSLVHSLIWREISTLTSASAEPHRLLQQQLLEVAATQWLARILLRDSPSDVALPFIEHFISGNHQL